jgi:hypothetical protein
VLRQVIIKSGNKYSTIDGLDLCNGGEVATFDNAVSYLDSTKKPVLHQAKINKEL